MTKETIDGGAQAGVASASQGDGEVLEGTPVAGDGTYEVPAPPERTDVDVGLGKIRATGRAWDAVRAANDLSPSLFRFGDAPVRLEKGENGPIARPLDQAKMDWHTSMAVRWVKRDGHGGPRETDAPLRWISVMLAHPDPPLPRLRRIVYAPVFAPDGTLSTEPGYNERGETFFVPAEDLRIGPVYDFAGGRPAADHSDFYEYSEALDAVLEPLEEFPFVDDADRANAVALMLLPFVRDLIKGPTPLHLITKPTMGTGGTLLAEVLLYPALGEGRFAVMSQQSGEDEWRKSITAALLEAPAAVVLDNVTRLASPNLERALTAKVWSDRILGQSRMVHVPVRPVWVATGNNVSLGGAMPRRVLPIRLDAGVERPWEERKFRLYMDRWLPANRGRLIHACLTLCSRWVTGEHQGGRDWSKERSPMGAFDDWFRSTSALMEAAGVEGFAGNLESARNDDEEQALRDFVAAWWEEHGQAGIQAGRLAWLAQEYLAIGGADASAKLGYQLRKMRNRWFGGLQVTRDERTRTWALRPEQP